MNVLVTGAAGYVGSVCAAELVKRAHRVVAYDNLAAGHRAAVVSGAEFVCGDIADTAKLTRVLRKYSVEAVMHFAASALVDESIRDPHSFYQNNVCGTLALLEVLAQHAVKKFIFSSSAAVYGEPECIPILEDHRTAPINAYGETKLVIERALAWYHRAYGLNYIALRYFNAAGATDQLGEDHRPETHLLPRVLDQALKGGSEFEIYGDDYPTPDGTCIRDFVHVVDIAQAHILALARLPALRSAIYNIGRGRGYSVREVIQAVQGVTGRSISVRVGGRRPGDPAVLVAGSEKIARELGWVPKLSDVLTIVKSAWNWRRKFPRGYERSTRVVRAGRVRVVRRRSR